MIRPTQRRLTLIFITVIVSFSILILFLSYLFLHQAVTNSVKRHLADDVRTEFLDQFQRSGLSPFRDMWDENHFQILNRSGEVVISSRNSVDFYTPVNMQLLSEAFSNRQGFEEMEINYEPYIISYFPIDGTYVGRVAASLAAEAKSETAFLRLIIITFPGMLVISYLVSMYLVRHAMKPISDIFMFQETFSSNVSHELRSPIASLKGNFEVSLRKERTAEEYREIIRFGLGEIDRIIDLLNNLSMLASSKFRPLDLFRNRADIGKIVRDLAAVYAASAEGKGVRFEAAEIGSFKCLCDESLLRRSIENLFDNAVKYTPEGGTIRASLSRGAGNIILNVSNSSAKLDRGEISHIFEPFYRGTKSSPLRVEGKGLGLYIARYIIRSHGGDIRIDNSEGNVFSITLLLPDK